MTPGKSLRDTQEKFWLQVLNLLIGHPVKGPLSKQVRFDQEMA